MEEMQQPMYRGGPAGDNSDLSKIFGQDAFSSGTGQEGGYFLHFVVAVTSGIVCLFVLIASIIIVCRRSRIKLRDSPTSAFFKRSE